MSKQREDLSRQQNLSVFFSPKVESHQTLRSEWDDHNNERQHYQSPTESKLPPPKNQGNIRKRVLPRSIGAVRDISMMSETATDRPSGIAQPKQTAYGMQKSMKSIGGVQFVAPAVKKRSRKDDVDVQNISDSEKISLSDTQMRVIEAILARRSVFFTGAAGTGKSYVLRVLQDIMENLGLSDKIAFTAPTGVAACNVRGLTIHSWSGIGRGTDPRDKICSDVMKRKEVKSRWCKTEILVIDEISMLSAEMFDILSFIGSRVRNDPRPFGGMQIILCGDFFQLPPVGLGNKNHFCFDSAVWQSLLGKGGMIVLDKVFRQKDSSFLRLLNELRRGIVSSTTNQTLSKKVQDNRSKNAEKKSSGFQKSSSLSTSVSASTMASRQGQGQGRDKDDEVAVRPTKLYATNRDVDSYNASELCRLSEEASFTFTARDEGIEQYLRQLTQGLKAPKELELRVGAQVMLLKNLSTADGLVNGARGVIIRLEKSEGRSDMYPVVPVVQFSVAVGEQRVGLEMSLKEEVWDIRLGERIVASRTQIPLMLAWAISVHKSQGMTIPLLEVSFEGMFEYGQGYVALSRATDLEGLTLQSFNPTSVKAHQRVKEFYKAMGNEGTETVSDEVRTTSLTLLSGKYNSKMLTFEEAEAARGGDIDLDVVGGNGTGAGSGGEWMTSTSSSVYSDAAASASASAAIGGLGGNDDDWLERPGRVHPRQSTTSISTSAAAAAAAAAAVYRPHGSSSSGSYGKNVSDARSSSGSGSVSVGGHRSTWDVQAIRDSSHSNTNPNPRDAYTGNSSGGWQGDRERERAKEQEMERNKREYDCCGDDEDDGDEVQIISQTRSFDKFNFSAAQTSSTRIANAVSPSVEGNIGGTNDWSRKSSGPVSGSVNYAGSEAEELELSSALRDRIEKNRLAALKRLEENRRMRQEASMDYLKNSVGL